MKNTNVITKHKLPDSWEMVDLGEISKVSSGNPAPQNKTLFKDGKYPFCRTSDVGRIHISNNFTQIRDHLNDEGIKGLTLFKKNTILFPKSGASTYLNHRVILGLDSYVSSHLATISANHNKILSKFLFYRLLLIDAKKMTNDQNYPSLRLPVIKEIKIPLPPLSEQKRIVAILDEQFISVEQAERAATEQLEYVRALPVAYLREVLPNSADELPVGWEVVSLGDVCQFIRGITFSPKDKVTDKGSFVLVATTRAAQSDGIHFDDLVKIKPELVKQKETYLQLGDILISVANSLKLLGRKTFIKELPKSHKYSFGAFMGLLRSNKKKILPNFLDIFLGTVEYKSFCLSRANTTTNISNLNWRNLQTFKILLPPLSEQKRIVAILDEKFAAVAQTEQATIEQLEAIQALKLSFLRRAFTGEI